MELRKSQFKKIKNIENKAIEWEAQTGNGNSPEETLLIDSTLKGDTKIHIIRDAAQIPQLRQVSGYECRAPSEPFKERQGLTL